ncbi:MAG: FMN-binding protein, partial [Clostridia bacterium]|nr:FMN-binding protein [Clostridia bacterium]
ETAGLGAKTKDPAFAQQFIGLTYQGEEIQYNAGGSGYLIPAGSLKVERIESTGTDPDAVSGATYSSTAVIHAVNNIVKELGSLLSGGEK